MTQIGSRPARIELPAIESWPWEQEQMDPRTRLYQPQRRPVAPAPAPAHALATAPAHAPSYTTPSPRGWTRQAAVPQLQQQIRPDPRYVEDPGPDLSNDLFQPVPTRGLRLRGRSPRLPRVRLPRIRLPRLRPIHVIIFTMGVVAVLMVGLAVWAWQSERDPTQAAAGDDPAQIPITVITVSGTAEDGTAVKESRVSHTARSFRRRRWSRRHTRRRARRSRARRRQVDVDGILAAGLKSSRRQRQVEP